MNKYKIINGIVKKCFVRINKELTVQVKNKEAVFECQLFKKPIIVNCIELIEDGNVINTKILKDPIRLNDKTNFIVPIVSDFIVPIVSERSHS